MTAHAAAHVQVSPKRIRPPDEHTIIMGARPPQWVYARRIQEVSAGLIFARSCAEQFEVCVIDFRFDDRFTLSSCFGSLAL